MIRFSKSFTTWFNWNIFCALNAFSQQRHNKCDQSDQVHGNRTNKAIQWLERQQFKRRQKSVRRKKRNEWNSSERQANGRVSGNETWQANNNLLSKCARRIGARISNAKECIVNSTTIYSHLERLCKMHFKIIKGIIEYIKLSEDRTITTGAAVLQTNLQSQRWRKKKKYEQQQYNNNMINSLSQCHRTLTSMECSAKNAVFGIKQNEKQKLAFYLALLIHHVKELNMYAWHFMWIGFFVPSFSLIAVRIAHSKHIIQLHRESYIAFDAPFVFPQFTPFQLHHWWWQKVHKNKTTNGTETMPRSNRGEKRHSAHGTKLTKKNGKWSIKCVYYCRLAISFRNLSPLHYMCGIRFSKCIIICQPEKLWQSRTFARATNICHIMQKCAHIV